MSDKKASEAITGDEKSSQTSESEPPVRKVDGDERARGIWNQMIAALEDKLQYGFLQHAREVIDVTLKSSEASGTEMTLFVYTDQEVEFFQAEVNLQRLQIVSRPFMTIDSFRVVKITAAP